MYEDLTGVQIAILEYIKDELQKRNYPPSVREICASVGLNSTSSVHYQLNNLEKKGYLRRDPQKPRALEIVKENNGAIPSVAEQVVNVPMLGKVAAGAPILAQEEYENYYPLPLSFTNNADCFMLTVQGCSMINVGIMDGDFVVVKRQNSAIDGEIVVALIDDEATVKTFYKENDTIRLQPENPMLAPIYSKNAVILGKVIGVIRHY